MKKYVVILLLVLSVGEGFSQQDPRFSTYMFNPQFVNPAYIGTRENISAVLITRNQWVNFGNGAPQSNVLSLAMPIKVKKMGLGLDLYQETIGPKDAISLAGSYAYRLDLGRGRLSFATRVGYDSYTYNWNEIEYRDQGDPYNALGVQKYGILTFDFGTWYQSRTFYAGLNVSNLNNSTFQFNIPADNAEGYNTGLESTMYTIIGKAFPLGENFVLRTSVLGKTTNYVDPDLDVNVSVLYKEKFWLGLGVGGGERTMLLLEYSINKKLRIGYGYDVNRSRMQTPYGGSHDLFISYDFNVTKSELRSPRYF